MTLKATAGLFLPLLLACSAGGFGGLGSAKSDGESGSKSSQEQDEGLGDDEDQETDQADEPAEVAGAFLTVACAPTSAKPSHLPAGDFKAYGCAVIDRDTREFIADAKISNVIFAFKDGENQVVPLVDAPAGTPWHVYTYVDTSRVPSLKNVHGFATAKEVAIETVNTDFRSYDPEGLVQTTADEKVGPDGSGLPLTVLHAFPSGQELQASYAIDNVGTSTWRVSAGASPVEVWVIFDLGDQYAVHRLEYETCASHGDPGEVSLGKAVANLPNGNLAQPSVVDEFEGGPGLPHALEIDPKDAKHTARYLKFTFDQSISPDDVCLNSVKIFGTKAGP